MMKLSELTQAVNGKHFGEDRLFSGVSTDTRSLQQGELFVALSGPNFDGNAFVTTAFDKGAVGALVSRCDDPSSPQVQVDDTRLALGSLAAYWRARFDIPVIAVTGSNGKTTVKEMLGSIMSGWGRGVVTQGNLNNDIGLPLTLLRLREGDHYAVLEMGMNHSGEIAYLTQIAKPDVALINNAAGAHLEGLGSVENVARAKGEIFSGLAASGTAVINADDDYAALWEQLAEGRRIMTFGLVHEADISADFESSGMQSRIHLHTPRGERDLLLPLPGRHNVMNALAATAAAFSAGVDLDQIVAGLENVSTVGGRLRQIPGPSGSVVLDDTYNANPASLNAAIDVLAGFEGSRILVLGNMGELGDQATELHYQVGEYARDKGIDILACVGELAAHAGEGFGQHGYVFTDQASLTEWLQPRLGPDSVVLVKGSRTSHMENVVNALQEG